METFLKCKSVYKYAVNVISGIIVSFLVTCGRHQQQQHNNNNNNRSSSLVINVRTSCHRCKSTHTYMKLENDDAQ